VWLGNTLAKSNSDIKPYIVIFCPHLVVCNKPHFCKDIYSIFVAYKYEGRPSVITLVSVMSRFQYCVSGLDLVKLNKMKDGRSHGSDMMCELVTVPSNICQTKCWTSNAVVDSLLLGVYLRVQVCMRRESCCRSGPAQRLEAEGR